MIRYKSFKNKTMKLIASSMPLWWIYQSPDSFDISFYNDDKSNRFFIWAKGLTASKEFHISMDSRLPLKTIKYEDVFNLYMIERYPHKKVLCIELKNGSNVMVGL